MADAIALGIIRFPTKKDALEFLREILWRHPEGTILSGIEHYAVTKAYRLHPNRQSSIGILYHKIGMNYGEGYRQGAPGFHTYLANGTWTTWSYRAPIEQFDPRRWLMQAARATCLPVVRAWKSRQFGGKPLAYCQECAGLVAWDESHVHHMPPWEFRVIVEAWSQGRTAEVEKVDGVAVLTARASFLEFHDARADLRLVCKSCHAKAKKWRPHETPFRTINRRLKDVA